MNKETNAYFILLSGFFFFFRFCFADWSLKCFLGKQLLQGCVKMRATRWIMRSWMLPGLQTRGLCPGLLSNLGGLTPLRELLGPFLPRMRETMQSCHQGAKAAVFGNDLLKAVPLKALSVFFPPSGAMPFIMGFLLSPAESCPFLWVFSISEL